MGASQKNIVLGVVSLLISAVLQAAFSSYLHNGRIVLVFTCIYAVLFLKYLKDESVVNWLTGRWSKKTLKIIGIIVLFMGLAFIPQSPEQHTLAITAEFVVYLVTYICWMVGLLLIDISKER